MNITAVIIAAVIVGGTGLIHWCIPWTCRKEICRLM